MAKVSQPNCSFRLQDATLENLRILANLRNTSVNQLVNAVLTNYVEKFSAELCEFANVTRTTAQKIVKKFLGDSVIKIAVEKLHTNTTGTQIAATLYGNVIATVTIAEVDEEKATGFVQKAVATIGGNAYEITRAEKSIVVSIGEKTLSQQFDDAGTAEKIEVLIDDVIAQITKMDSV